MTGSCDRTTFADDRVQRGLLVAANALPVAALALGASTLPEVLLVYVLEPAIVALASTAKLLVVDPPATERSSPVLSLDRDWLARPVRVTRWSARRALGHVGRYAFAMGFYYGFAAVIVVLLAGTVQSAAGLGSVSVRWILLLTAGFAVGQLRDLWLFVLGWDRRRADPDGLLERARHESKRLQALSVLYVAFGVGLFALPWPVAVAIGYFAVKTAVDLRSQSLFAADA